MIFAGLFENNVTLMVQHAAKRPDGNHSLIGLHKLPTHRLGRYGLSFSTETKTLLQKLYALFVMTESNGRTMLSDL